MDSYYGRALGLFAASLLLGCTDDATSDGADGSTGEAADTAQMTSMPPGESVDDTTRGDVSATAGGTENDPDSSSTAGDDDDDATSTADDTSGDPTEGDDTGATSTADDSGTAGGSSGDGTTGDGEGSTGDSGTGTTGGMKRNPGSCRDSEVYGSAGAPPAFEDEAYADFDGAVLVMTSGAESDADIVLRVFDISGPTPPPNENYPAPMYFDPDWTSETFGGAVFGLTLDSDGNLYTVATQVFLPAPDAPGAIYRVDGVTGEVSVLVELPNFGPALGNINYDCHSETLYVSNHDDGRIYQVELDGTIRSTYHHGSGSVALGPPIDPDEPDGAFSPLGDRVWAVQSHAGRLYYSVWVEDVGSQEEVLANEIWSVAYEDDDGVPAPETAQLEVELPALMDNDYSNPVADISFAGDGAMLVAERSMSSATMTTAHQSRVLRFDYDAAEGWEPSKIEYVVAELPNSAAGGIDHDLAEDGYVWMTGDALDFYTMDVVYGAQGTPLSGGDITNSTLIDHDGEIVAQDKTAQGDVEIPIPDDADRVPRPGAE